MTSQTTSPRLTPKFVEAMAYAAEKHAQPDTQGQRHPVPGSPAIGGRVCHRGRRHRDGGHRRVAARRRRRPGRRRDAGRDPREVRRRRRVDRRRMQRHRSRRRSRRGASARKTTSATCPTRRTVRCWCRWPTSCTTLTRFCGTSARMAIELWQRFSVKDPSGSPVVLPVAARGVRQRFHNWMVDELTRGDRRAGTRGGSIGLA